MLVLGRRVGERVVMSNGVVVKVLAVRGQQVRLGFEAPEEVHIRREELAWADWPEHAAGAGEQVLAAL